MTAAGTRIGKILIANRGEIAVRIARTCRELGIETVVACSTEDHEATVHGAVGDVILIGPAPAARSYLNIAAIIEAARQTGCDAIHPGYGFLSEDADFAEVCAASGITFIGPPAEVLAELGDKSRARARMANAGLPLLPGSIAPVEDLAGARHVAETTGFPLIVKAVAGGGGRGMHVSWSASHLAEAFNRARRDAQAFFGDGRVYLERFVPHARHVEVQILRDSHGTTLELGERDCSVQRRHQKLIEETPAPGMPAGLLAEIRAATVRGADAVGHGGAGTFEFLVEDASRFYFMEVHGRIQVEHPVTEMATGVDLVRAQIRIASGQPAGLAQRDIVSRGAVIECRVNAEDPSRDFAPAPGRLAEFTPPAGPFVRVDTHAFPGMRVSPAYDPLLAKVIVWAPDREAAIGRMSLALADFRISGDGISTNISFLRHVLADPRFCRAEHSISLVQPEARCRPSSTPSTPIHPASPQASRSRPSPPSSAVRA
jgi:acetyl-CoA carboxylase, biotin carboxylase subunit